MAIIARKVKLQADNKTLELIADRSGWCSVFFKHAKTDELGADSQDIVVQRILAVLQLDDFPKPTHTLDREQYSCFIMLFEKHGCGYARKTPSGVLLHFRDGEGQPIGDINLTYKDCKLWIAQLEKFNALPSKQNLLSARRNA